jgi:hypothetical protein
MRKETFCHPSSSKNPPTQEARPFLVQRARILKHLGESRQGAGVVQALEKSFGMEFAMGQMVRRGKNQDLLQLSGPACRKDEGLDRLAIFYDVYVTRPGVRTVMIYLASILDKGGRRKL